MFTQQLPGHKEIILPCYLSHTIFMWLIPSSYRCKFMRHLFGKVWVGCTCLGLFSLHTSLRVALTALKCIHLFLSIDWMLWEHRTISSLFTIASLTPSTTSATYEVLSIYSKIMHKIRKHLVIYKAIAGYKNAISTQSCLYTILYIVYIFLFFISINFYWYQFIISIN